MTLRIPVAGTRASLASVALTIVAALFLGFFFSGTPDVQARHPSNWKVLVLIYASTDFTYSDAEGQHHVVASMTQGERDRAAAAATRFFETDVPALDSGNMFPELTIRHPDQPLSELAPFCGYWPSRTSTAPELDPAFDSVIVIWDDTGIDQITGQPADLQNCGGLTLPNGVGQTYTTFPVSSVRANQRNVFKHEWGHSILFYYAAAGTAPLPAVSNHINSTDTQYVHCPTGEPYILVDETDDNPIPNSIYSNDRGFTHDYYSGTTATPDQPERCLGITPDAWASGGPVTGPTHPPVNRGASGPPAHVDATLSVDFDCTFLRVGGTFKAPLTVQVQVALQRLDPPLSTSVASITFGRHVTKSSFGAGTGLDLAASEAWRVEVTLLNKRGIVSTHHTPYTVLASLPGGEACE